MIYLIIGHRGAGKTLWLKKLKKIFKKSFLFIDLDQEIEQHTQKSISDLVFKNQKKFRQIEQNVLNHLILRLKAKNTFIAVGAGWAGRIPKNAEAKVQALHLMREADHQGRVFLNRPRLTSASPLKEYNFLFQKREMFYSKIKTQSFVVPEWDFLFTEPEKCFFGLKKQSLNAIITLNKNTLPKNKTLWKTFIHTRLKHWQLKFFELRDDQWRTRPKDLKMLLKIIPKNKQLLSLRTLKSSCFSKNNLNKAAWDFPLGKGPPPPRPFILSLHQRTSSQTLKQLSQKLVSFKARYFKLAVPVFNFTELLEGHLWFLKDPLHRSFLPAGPAGGGQWRWYRQIFGPHMFLNFIREARSPGPATKDHTYLQGLCEQPFLHEAVLTSLVYKKNKQRPRDFGAVLGNPTAHSASPAFYRAAFKNKTIFTKINMTQKELTQKNLHLLQKLGLVRAAVTSPLKKKAFLICSQTDRAAQKFQSVNTLIFKNKKWLGFNTDHTGLKALLNKAKISPANQKKTAVWGGGGMHMVLKDLLPQADFYSARTGQLKNPPASKGAYDIIIWAVGRKRMSMCRFPAFKQKPKLIIDLNYTDDSPGREYALKAKARYISGWVMFQAQAQAQKKLFLKRKLL